MAISSLASGAILTDKCNSRWDYPNIKWITPHQMWAKWDAETAANYFVTNGYENSVNYCIGYDGSLIQNVPEENRAWTSGSQDNDQYAITLELSNSDWNTENMTDDTLETFMKLCCDLLFRYPSLGGRLNYTGGTDGNITLHEWFQDTNCPGSFFKGKLPYLVQGVNERMDYYESKGYTSIEEALNPPEETEEEDMARIEELEAKIAELEKKIEEISSSEKLEPKESDWYYEPIQYCKEKGIMKGEGDGNFYPNKVVTRGTLATVVQRICESFEK